MSEAHVPMHVEHTHDPLTLRWIVRGGRVTGAARLTPDSSSLAGLPERWIEGLTSKELTAVVVGDGSISATVDQESAWSQIAPELNDSLTEFLEDGASIAITLDEIDDEALARAVEVLLVGPLSEYIAGHGGKIELDSVSDGIVTVRLIGACDGCPSSGTTLKAGIEEQIREQFPQIVAVHSIDGPATGGRRLLPIVGTS